MAPTVRKCIAELTNNPSSNIHSLFKMRFSVLSDFLGNLVCFYSILNLETAFYAPSDGH